MSKRRELAPLALLEYDSSTQHWRFAQEGIVLWVSRETFCLHVCHHLLVVQRLRDTERATQEQRQQAIARVQQVCYWLRLTLRQQQPPDTARLHQRLLDTLVPYVVTCDGAAAEEQIVREDV